MAKQHELKHDLDGLIFNYLEVIRPLDEKNNNGAYLYECRCLICGKLTKASRPDLNNGFRKTCGSHKCKTTAREYEHKKIMKYPGFSDCNGYASEHACSIVEEMFCRTRNKCSFYKSKEET